MDRFGFTINDALLNKIDDAIGKELRVNAKVPVVTEATEDGIGNGSNTSLKCRLAPHEIKNKKKK